MAKQAKPLENPSDRKFVEQVYEEHKRLIVAMAKKYAADPDDREDIAQTVAENLIKHVSTLRRLDKRALASYIIFSTRNTAINWGKTKKRQREVFTSLDDEEVIIHTEHLASDNPVEEFVISRMQLARLREIWHDLPEEDQILMEGKYIWGMTDRELAEDFHCKPDSIRMKLSRARKRARQLLTEMEEVQ